MQIIAYTDGSSRGNPGNGGYGLILIIPEKKYKKEFSEGFKLTTNNRMELLAVIKALEVLKKPNQEITIYTDSKYVYDAIEKKWVYGWKKKGFKDKKNKDLWLRFLKIYPKHNVKLEWIKGHSGNEWNERADKLATNAAKGENLKTDIGYENSINQPNDLM